MALDYRKYPFFKILYSETEAANVSMTRVVFVVVVLTAMMGSCLFSATQSTTAETIWDNLKGIPMELMVLLVAINECVSRKRMQRIMVYIDDACKFPRFVVAECSWMKLCSTY